MKKVLFLMLFLTCLGAVNVSAQVAIGDNKEPESFSVLELIGNSSGLRLPQLTATQREALDLSGKTLAVGLVIQNTTSGCIEYWNGKKWVSLCKGQANITFLPDPTQTPFPPEGEERGPVTLSDDPNCNSENPAYSFLVLVGADYLTITVSNPATGEFRVSMDENPAATPRTAIVRITNNCSQEYQEFVFTQNGDDTGCGTTAAVPAITSENGTSLCGTGAAYLYLTGRPATGTFIWTLNGQEVGRGTAYKATTAGKYTVYGDKIGCSNSQTVTVSASGGNAPASVSVVAAANNGFVCSAGAETTLFAVGSGNIVWYRDGVRQASKTGNSISAGAGVWFAVVESGSCSSLPSNNVTVSLDPNAGQAGINPVSFKVNGAVPSGNNISLCAGGALLLEVVSPQTDVTYKWYSGDEQNGVLLGTGATFSTTVAAVQSYPVLQCVASKPGACTQSQYTQFTVSASNPPAKPVITNPSGAYLCGTSATLTANSTGASTYAWYKDGVQLSETSATLIVTAEGIYTVYGANAGGCVSAVSNEFKIEGVSGYGTVTIRENGTTISGGAPVNVNESTPKTLVAAINPAGGENYVWTLTGNVTAPVLTGSSITVTFGAYASGTTARVSVAATNACTPGGVTAAADFTIQPNCPAAAVTAYSPASKTAEIVGSGNVTLSVTPNGDPGNFTYQWYNGGAINSATSQSYSASAAGTYYCIVTPKCGGTPATSDNFTVTVKTIPVTPGSGTLSGKVCYDIAETTCEGVTAANRAANKADFSQASTYHQTYTFTSAASGTVQNVSYAVVDQSGCVASHSGTGFTTGAFGNNATATITIDFKQTLNSPTSTPLVYGQGAGAAKVTIYVIYNNGTQDVQVSLTANIQDCSCCGAYVASGVWKEFMCYNLGADQSIDPFTPAEGLHGAMYKWGTGQVALTAAENIASSGSISGWASKGGTPPSGTSDWNMDTANPCPTGYRVPTSTELTGVANSSNNSITRTGSFAAGTDGWESGVRIGAHLFLPAAGYRREPNGIQDARNMAVMIWTSTVYNADNAYRLALLKTTIDTSANAKSNAESVRCIRK